MTKTTRSHRKGGLMIGISEKAAKIMVRLIGNVDLRATDVDIGTLKIRHISTFANGDELFSAGCYGGSKDDLICVPEIIFLRSEQEGVQKNGKYHSGIAAIPMYYPVSYKVDGYGIDKKCVWFDDIGEPDTFDRKEQKIIAVFASKWLRNIDKSGM